MIGFEGNEDVEVNITLQVKEVITLMHLSNVFIDSIPPEYFDGGDGDYTVGIYSKLFEAIQEFATERMSDDTI